MDRPAPLVSPEELRDRLGSESMTLLDVRWQLGRTDGLEEYLAGHIPGAAYVALEQDLAAPAGAGGRHPLPATEAFGEAMRRVGVRADRPVVVYDATGGLASARAWWLLRFHGHREVRLLDGGWTEWQMTGGPSVEGPVVTGPGDFVPSPGNLPVLDADGAALVARTGVLVDARAPERYAGEVEPVDPVAGHIPGAVNVPTAANLEADGARKGRFRDTRSLARTYADAVESPGGVAAYCGSGVTAAHDVLALEIVGVRAALYAGSWSEWVTDPGRPVETGR